METLPFGRTGHESSRLDSVLLPYNFSMMQQPGYARDFEVLLSLCAERGVAVQTIKSVARRRWPEGASPTRDCWYEPYEAQEEIDRAVHWVLARPGIFLNTVGDLALLPRVLDAADRFAGAPSDEAMRRAAERTGTRPLFARGRGRS